MRPALPLAIATALFSMSASAQDVPGEAEQQSTCEEKSLPSELAQLCEAIDAQYRETMSRPVDASGTIRVAPKGSPVRPPIVREVTGRGLEGTPAKSALSTPDDRGVGLRLRSTEAPVQLSTEMIQPGATAETIVNWELKAENAPQTSGVFYGAATGGTYNPAGNTENVSGFAGLRGVMNPADNFQLGAEIAPRAGVADLAAPQGSLSLEPKLSAKSSLGQLGHSDFVGTLDANAGYNMPLDGDPAAWGGFRFTVKPK
jgi:hypothetical protein